MIFYAYYSYDLLIRVRYDYSIPANFYYLVARDTMWYTRERLDGEFSEDERKIAERIVKLVHILPAELSKFKSIPVVFYREPYNLLLTADICIDVDHIPDDFTEFYKFLTSKFFGVRLNGSLIAVIDAARWPYDTQ